MLSQGAGGNTSLKEENTLWVKASGRWLKHAQESDIFVPMDLGGVRRLIDAGSDEGIAGLSLAPDSPLRPSIETTLHALMPQRVVLHCHSIRTLAFAARMDARARLDERLDGLNWAFVPYRRPGMPLTLVIRDLLQDAVPDVLVLGNHGLVVAGEEFEDAEALLEEVESRLDAPTRESGAPRLDLLSEIAHGTPYRMPSFEVVHGLATNHDAIRVASKGSLYPDHVVFLGRGAARIGTRAELDALVENGVLPGLVLVEGFGALVRSNLSVNAEEMVRALALVVEKVDADAALKYLTLEEEGELLCWDAEKYRQSLQTENRKN